MVVPQKGSGCVSQLDWQIGHVNYNLPPFHRFLLPSLNSWRLIFVCVRSDIFVCSSSDGLGTPKPAVSSWRRSTSPSHWGIKLHRHKTLVLPPFFLFPVPARRSRPHAVRIYTNCYIARAMHILPTKKKRGVTKKHTYRYICGVRWQTRTNLPPNGLPCKRRKRKKKKHTHTSSIQSFFSLSLSPYHYLMLPSVALWELHLHRPWIMPAIYILHIGYIYKYIGPKYIYIYDNNFA